MPVLEIMLRVWPLSCKLLKIKGVIFMPAPTPNQKVEQVKLFGGDYVTIVLEGDTFDDAYHLAVNECEKTHKTFIHPFDDKKVIEGQATIALEILEQPPNLSIMFLWLLVVAD